jgi:hypothetical protein
VGGDHCRCRWSVVPGHDDKYATRGAGGITYLVDVFVLERSWSA